MFPNKIPVKLLETLKVLAMSPPIPKFCMSIRNTLVLVPKPPNPRTNSH